ncbi:MAG TPA: transcription antitermination factor NusB [Candidatus Polarisedimenticolaceae bacterium]|nr:transcription antitermination factor NusB [Candidatus Polarisedimenticolaceae bacterium]
MGQRRRARECALQMLFQIELGGQAPAEACEQFWHGQEASSELRAFAEQLVHGVCAARVELDRLIATSTEHWRIERMAVVDRNILRIAAFELLHGADTPAAVVIDEAIEVAKKFGSAESGAFINGILDAIVRRAQEAR